MEGSTGTTRLMGTIQEFLHFPPCRVSGPPSRTVVKFRRIHYGPQVTPTGRGYAVAGVVM